MQVLAHRCRGLSLLLAISLAHLLRAASAGKVFLPSSLVSVAFIYIHISRAHHAFKLCCSNATEAGLGSLHDLPTTLTFR